MVAVEKLRVSQGSPCTDAKIVLCQVGITEGVRVIGVPDTALAFIFFATFSALNEFLVVLTMIRKIQPLNLNLYLLKDRKIAPLNRLTCKASLGHFCIW